MLTRWLSLWFGFILGYHHILLVHFTNDIIVRVIWKHIACDFSKFTERVLKLDWIFCSVPKIGNIMIELSIFFFYSIFCTDKQCPIAVTFNFHVGLSPNFTVRCVYVHLNLSEHTKKREKLDSSHCFLINEADNYRFLVIF